MIRSKSWFFLLLLVTSLLHAQPRSVEYVDPVLPYAKSTAFKGKFNPVTPGQKILPILTWGPDGHLVTSNGGLKSTPSSPAAKALGEPIELKVMDRVDDQVQALLSGQPFFRGTVAQVALVNEGLRAINPGLELVVIYQISWSTGADGFVTVNTNTLQDLKGRVIVGQLNGPHMLDMVPKILEDAGFQPGDVKIKYVADISTPNTEVVARATDPANALRNDRTLAGAAMISPDISAVTSGEGRGAVAGSKSLFTTRTANRLIADVIAVRKDYFEKNEESLKKLVKVWLEEANSYASELDNIAKKKAADQSRITAFKKKIEPLAALFLGDASLVNDYLLWIGVDAELAKVKGNVEFVQSKNNPVGFAEISAGVQRQMVKIGFLTASSPLKRAAWDWSSLGASAFATALVKAPVFASSDSIRQAAAKADANALFKHDFPFAAKEAELDWRNYENIFDIIHSNVKRYGGAIIQIRGHADPLLYNFFKMKIAKGESTYSKGTQTNLPIPPLEAVANANNKLSYTRAAAIRTAYAAYLREKIGVSPEEIDLSRFDLRGMGTSDPVYANPVTKEQTAANMRGELVIIAVETEISGDFNIEDLK